jgi:hypothetical protein
MKRRNDTMYIKDITVGAIFVREIKIGNKVGYFVNEIYTENVYNISITNDPLKAKHYTFTEAYKNTYAKLDESEKERIRNAHKDNDGYDVLARYVAKEYKIITVDTIDYGYEEDTKAEYDLLASIGLAYMVTEPTVTNIENEGE